MKAMGKILKEANGVPHELNEGQQEKNRERNAALTPKSDFSVFFCALDCIGKKAKLCEKGERSGVS